MKEGWNIRNRKYIDYKDIIDINRSIFNINQHFE